MRVKASFTIEAALIMPVLITVILFVLFIGFYENDRAVIAEKTFLYARKMAFGDETDHAYLTQMEAESIYAKSIETAYSSGRTATEVVSEGSVGLSFINGRLAIKSRQFYTKCYAPEMIRKVNALVRLKNTIID